MSMVSNQIEIAMSVTNAIVQPDCISISTADIERSVMYGDGIGAVPSPFGSLISGQVLPVVNIAGRTFYIDESAVAPWPPIPEIPSLLSLGNEHGRSSG